MGFAFQQIHGDVESTADLSGRSKQSGCRCQPWFYLRLAAYSFFWLSEGAYGYSRDSVRIAPFRLTPFGMLTLEPERRKITTIAESIGDSKVLHSAQAACCFRNSASKHTPFFQTSRVMAAIFRASVRRAIEGFVPRATMAA